MTYRSFGMDIIVYPLKPRVMTFKVQVRIRSRIVIDNNVCEQVNTVPYLGCKISHEKEYTISEISNYLRIFGILNNVLKLNLVQRQS
jgi:hypothetical protein